MRALRLHLAYKNIKRLRTIVGALTKHGFRPFMERLHLMKLLSLHQRVFGRRVEKEEAMSPAVRLRLALEELGPTFIKFGQILSTRPDILPEEFITELLKLQDEVPPFPFSAAVSTIEKELRRPVSGLFSSIEETPVAAASISQVHRAVLASGTEVMVKVQRPDISEVIETDVAILGYLARLVVKYIPEIALYDPVGIVDEFSTTITKEMDFTLEGSYMERFREVLSDDPRVVIPEVHWEHTGKKVLTMGRLEGVKIDRIGRLDELGINRRKVAHLITDIFFKQVFELGIFHGDLHSGNIFVISEEKIGLVDFGIVGRLDKDLRENLADVLISFATEDFDGLVKVYQKMGILPERIDKAAFEREYYDIILHYFGRPFKCVKIGELLLDYIRLSARHHIMLPRDLMLFDKCLIELEGLARLLYPEANLLEESGAYASKLYKERISPSAFVKEAASTFSDYNSFARRLPGQAEEIMKKVIDDRLRIEFIHRGLEDFMGEVDRSSNRLTLGLVMAALVIGSSLVISAETYPKIGGYAVLGILGFIIASMLGFWLAIQILRSGKF